jgi:hypothetical protein
MIFWLVACPQAKKLTPGEGFRKLHAGLINARLTTPLAASLTPDFSFFAGAAQPRPARKAGNPMADDVAIIRTHTEMNEVKLARLNLVIRLFLERSVL